MKKMMMIGWIMSSFLVTNSMKLDKLDIDTNGDCLLSQAIEQLKKNHPELLKLIPEDNHQQIVGILQEKRPNLVNYVMTQEGSISEEELIKQYGSQASDYFKSYISLGAAFLDVMNDQVYQKKAKKMEKNKQVQLAILCKTLDECITSIDDKKSYKKTKEDESLKKITEPLEKEKGRFFDDNSSKKLDLKNVLCSQYGTLYRVFPEGHDDLVLERFLDKYPALAQTLLCQKNKKNKVHIKTKSVINVELVGNMVLENSESLRKLYEKYKVLKALLESTGINVGAIQAAVNEDLQLIVDGLVEKTKELRLFITHKLEKCCVIN